MKRFCITMFFILFSLSILNGMQPVKAKTDLVKMKMTQEHSFYGYYNKLIEDNENILLTSDFLFYNEHLILDYSIRYAEEEYMCTMLKEMLDSLISAMQSDWKGLEAKKAASARSLAVSYLCTSRYLLSNDIKLPESLKKAVLDECSKVDEAAGFANSSIFAKKEDYSQYIPRGHYNDSEKLKRYFKAMMYLQRMGFNSSIPGNDPYSELRASVLLGETLSKFNSKNGIYRHFTQLISILLQQQDDISLLDTRSLWNHGLSEKDILNDSYMKELAKKVKNESNSKILSDLLADTEEKPVFINFMGQRYIYDSELFCNLVYDKVLEYKGRNQNAFTLASGIRHVPRGLDLMYALGSTDAYLIMEKEGDVQYKNYSENSKSMIKVFEEMDKGKAFYNRMLLQYQSVLKGRNDNLPVFMADPLWRIKELNTLLSSWSSLRRDVILYAKQSYTVKVTSAMPGKQVQEEKRIIAEPYIALYEKMGKDVEYLSNSLYEQTGDEVFKSASSAFSSLADIYKTASILTQKGKYYSDLSALSSAVKNLEYSLRKLLKNKSEKDDNTMTVADVHTDVNSSVVLEEASGPLAQIDVVYLGKAFQGGVLTYFEFKHPMNDRLTDEKWREAASESDLTKILFQWQKELFQ